MKEGRREETQAGSPGLRGKLGRLHPRSYLKSAFARGVAILAGGTVLGQVIALATTPLLSRLYSPSDFGALAVFTSVTLIWNVVSSLRYEFAIPLPEESGVAADVLGVGTIVLGVEVAVGLPITLVIGPAVCRALNVASLAPWVWLVPLGVLVVGIYQLLYFWAIRERAYRRIATTKVSQGLWRAGVQCGLGVLNVAPGGLLIGQVVGNAAGSVSLTRLVRGQAWARLRRPTRPRLAHAARRYVRFATYGSVSGLLNMIGLQLTPLVFAFMFGSAVAGLFGLTQRLLMLPLMVLGTAVSEAYVGMAPKLLRDDPAALQHLFVRATTRLFLIGLGPTLAVMIAGPWLFGFVFGERWTEAGEFARLLAPAILVQLAVSPMSQTTNVFERQDWQALVDFSRVALLAVVFAAAGLWGWSANAAVLGVSIALSVTYAMTFYLGWILLRARLKTAERA